MASSILLARQPIFDKQLNTIAYELLYRDAEGIGPRIPFDGTKATAEVLLHAYSSILQNGRIKTLPAFINFNADWLYNGNMPSLRPEALVLEVLEDVAITEQILEQLNTIVSAGYRVALDDFMYDQSWVPALKLAKIVKIDLQQLSPTQLIEHVEELKKHNVTLLAEKVETQEEFNYCKQLGFKLFQGYFFCHPQLVEGRKLTGNDATILQLIAELQNPDTSPQALEGIICKDPELVLRLLKIVNSARFALSREISSISDAIIALGLDELRKWALLISVTNNNHGPSELTREVLTRARMCELAAEQYSVSSGSAFMTGMLSSIDAMLNLELKEIMQQLPVAPEVKNALLFKQGKLGLLLDDVKHFMAAEWENLALPEALACLSDAQESSLNWVLETQQELHN